MGSKREEERNEKVIRGLMKLPPNRRCINCNNLGPGYVCTNFWTFVCITCSGIHREFTHRVKSVSMAKFTSQEVEALQKGGNQRARETYLVHWDPQKQKQPNSSHVEKVREFIKHVYVNKKYAAGRTSDKPPAGTQNLRHAEDETRRASSYHSYSQSPPYDTQYEERRYGRQLPVLTRKPGSDRGLYEGKVSNFSSPSRFSDQTLEPPRASDYSATSSGFSPNFQRDGRVKSPNYQINDSITKENPERVRRTQRATSSGSFGSFDSNNSLSFKSNNSVTLADLVSAPDEIIQNKQNTISSLPESSSSSTTFGGLDLFETPFAPNIVTPSLEAQPKAPIDLFEPSSISSVPNVYAQKPLETTPTSLDFFSQMPPQQPPSVTMGKTSPAEVVPKNEGWAMFDFPQQVPPTEPMSIHNTAQEPVSMDNIAHEPMSTHNISHEPSIHNIWHGEPYESQVSFTNTHVVEGKNAHELSIHNIWHGEPYESQVSFTNTHVVEEKNAHESTPVHSIAHEPAVIHNIAHDPVSMHNLWNGEPYKSQVSFTNTQVNEGNNAHEPTSKPNLWHGEQYKSQVPLTNNQQSWDAFEDPTKQLSYSATHQGDQEVAYQTPFTNVDQYLGDFNQTGFQIAVFENRPPITNIPSHVEARQHVIERKSSNPFELSDDCEFESGSMYLDMNSLQAELPTGQLQNAFVDDVNQSWFVHNPAPRYIPPAQQGALGYMGGPSPGIQMTNVPTQEPVASVGGNPFA